MAHHVPATVVSDALIYCDGKLLVEMTDGSLLQFNLNRAPNPRLLEGWGRDSLRFRTRDQLIQMVGDLNREAMLSANEALRMDKVRRLGWDHEQRGY